MMGVMVDLMLANDIYRNMSGSFTALVQGTFSRHTLGLCQRNAIVFFLQSSEQRTICIAKGKLNAGFQLAVPLKVPHSTYADAPPTVFSLCIVHSRP